MLRWTRGWRWHSAASWRCWGSWRSSTTSSRRVGRLYTSGPLFWRPSFHSCNSFSCSRSTLNICTWTTTSSLWAMMSSARTYPEFTSCRWVHHRCSLCISIAVLSQSLQRCHLFCLSLFSSSLLYLSAQVCVMYTRLCPDGAEGASFALLTTFGNVSGACAGNIGGLLSRVWCDFPTHFWILTYAYSPTPSYAGTCPMMPWEVTM